MNEDNSNSFIIKDMIGFIESTRALVFNSFGKTEKDIKDDINLNIDPIEKDEIDKVLSFDESEIICKEFLKKQINKKTKSIRYILTDDIFLSIVESLNDRMVSNVLNSLVNKGLVETAYDSESNDFVFWVKDKNENDQKPETD